MPDAESQSFIISPKNYLSLEFDLYQERLYEVRTSNPKLYSELRRKAMDKLITSQIDNLYKTVMDFMTQGRIGGVNMLNDMKPQYPAQLSSQLALEIARAQSQLLYKVIDRIIPKNDSPPIFMNEKIDGTDP